MEKYCLKIDFYSMGVIPLTKNQWTAIKILFQTSLSPLGVYSYMEVTKSVQDGILGHTNALWSKTGKNTDKIAIQSFTVPRARE